MDTTKTKREVLLEIREHTIDSDWNRAQHFDLYNRYIRLVKVVHALEAGLLFMLLLYYIISYSWPGLTNIHWANNIPVGLSVFAICVQMFDYYTNFNEKADQHWTAAQAYARLYRECQFFPAHYANISIEETTRVLHDICNELHDLNTLSPSLDQKSFEKANKALDKKKYPIDRIINEIYDEILENVIEQIKNTFQNYKIEIYLYGSYVQKIVYDDIDLAIVVYEEIDSNEADKKAVSIENAFKEVPIDITVVRESDLKNDEQIPYIRNIQKGKCLFKSKGIEGGLEKKTLRQPDYSSIIKSYYDNMQRSKGDAKGFIENAYDCYYYIIASVLDNKGKQWDGEGSLLYEFKKLSSGNKYEKILKQFMLLRNKKNKRVSLNAFSDEVYKETVAIAEEFLTMKLGSKK